MTEINISVIHFARVSSQPGILPSSLNVPVKWWKAKQSYGKKHWACKLEQYEAHEQILNDGATIIVKQTRMSPSCACSTAFIQDILILV